MAANTSPKSVTLSFRAAPEKAKALEAMSASLGVDKTTLLNQILSDALAVHDWQLAHIRKGIEEAADGNLISEKEAAQFFEEILK